MGLATLLPFSLTEIDKNKTVKDVNEIMFQGSYPRLHVQKIRPTVFYDSYINTYLEKDARQMSQLTPYAIDKYKEI